MKFLFVGAGAIGSLLGAYFAKGGADVTLLGRGEHITAISKSGLKVCRANGDSFRVRLRALSDSKSIQHADILIMCVKSPQTESALTDIHHLKDTVSLALSVQNGVEKEETLIRYFGKERVCGAICFEGATINEPAEVHHTMSYLSYVGELNGELTDRITKLRNIFLSGGLEAEAISNIIAAEWAKWAVFSAAAAVCTMSRLEYYKVLINRELASLVAEIYREYAQLATAKGIPLIDLPGFQFRSIAEAASATAVDLLAAIGAQLEAKGMKHSKPSLLQDVEKKKETEFESIFGHALFEADKHGLKMPLTHVAYKILKGLDQSFKQ
jgi:2-dehydropantoate 2-reductase